MRQAILAHVLGSLRRPPRPSWLVPDPTDGLAERRSMHAAAGRQVRRNPALHQDGFIYDPRRHFGHIGNLMAVEAKAFDNLTVDALIGEERHREIVSSG